MCKLNLLIPITSDEVSVISLTLAFWNEESVVPRRRFETTSQRLSPRRPLVLLRKVLLLTRKRQTKLRIVKKVSDQIEFIDRIDETRSTR